MCFQDRVVKAYVIRWIHVFLVFSEKMVYNLAENVCLVHFVFFRAFETNLTQWHARNRIVRK